VGLLHDLAPNAPVFAHLVNPNFPSTEDIIEEVDKAAALLGLKPVVLKAASTKSIQRSRRSRKNDWARCLSVRIHFFSACGINSSH
jgi:hypothetical protein